MNPYDGTSAFLITITLKNTTSEQVELSYRESVISDYMPVNLQRIPKDEWKVKLERSFKEYRVENIVVGINKATSEDPFLIPEDPDEMSEYDGFPPSLFLKIMDKDGKVRADGANLEANYKFTLSPGQEKIFQIVVGYTFDNSAKKITGLANTAYSGNRASNKFEKEWMMVLPSFPEEQNEIFKREMVWNAYNLEAMATYSEYYQETKIPQGTVYAYQWGVYASLRDNYQHAMPLPHYNPALAKSVLKYMMKRTSPQGRAKLIEWGFGYSSSWYFYTSDQQLFSFMYVAEYLRVTGDYNILNEKVAFFPYRNMPEATILDFIEAEFRFLRDQVKTGKHGLVRLLNSDWNDAIYHIVKEPYNNVFYSGESHMNSAMAISILEALIPQLLNAKSAFPDLSQRLDRLIQSMQLYRDGIENAFMTDLGDRIFPRRMYFNGKAYGEENMFLEPQGYTLQMDRLSKEHKQALYNEMKERVYKGEKIAARQQQVPEFESDEFEKGSRENGGVWWALNGPVILGVAGFDKPEAWRLLQNITFDHFARQFPEYWSSYWSQADNFESSLMPGEGLPDQTDNMFEIPVFCAHAHAWPLYCYYKLKEE
jgi:cellobiose phosphorylase